MNKQLNRRSFVKTGGIAAALAAFAPQTLWQPQRSNRHVSDSQFLVQVAPSGTYTLLTAQGVRVRQALIPATTIGEVESFDIQADLASQTSQNPLQGEARIDSDLGLDIAQMLPDPMDLLLAAALFGSQREDWTKYAFAGEIRPLTSKGDLITSSEGAMAPEPAWGVGGQVGPLYVRASVETHYVGGCIRANTPHVGLLVKWADSNRMVFDLHVCAWYSSGSYCLGVYESASGWCSKACSRPSDFTSVLQSMIKAVGSTKLTALLAVSLAIVATPLVLGGLIVIPGVPPPP